MPRPSMRGWRGVGIAPGGDVKFSKELLEIDDVRRRVITELQRCRRAESVSKEIGKAKAAKVAPEARTEIDATVQKRWPKWRRSKQRVGEG